MFAFLIPAALAGITIVFVLPWLQGWIAQIPGISQVASNRAVQVLIIGSIFLVSFGLLGTLARRVKL